MMLTDERLTELAETFRLMGDPSRLKIMLACLDAPICVGDIASRTGLSLSLVSHHLRLLRGVRILRAERQGRHVFYRAQDAHVTCVLRDMVVHVSEAEEAADPIRADLQPVRKHEIRL
jgi:ArsR family transcriptional regulator, lead/cadmium/zinc/bismuth-responsive transcriptional repressor